MLCEKCKKIKISPEDRCDCLHEWYVNVAHEAIKRIEKLEYAIKHCISDKVTGKNYEATVKHILKKAMENED